MTNPQIQIWSSCVKQKIVHVRHACIYNTSLIIIYSWMIIIQDESSNTNLMFMCLTWTKYIYIYIYIYMPNKRLTILEWSINLANMDDGVCSY